MSSTFQPPLSAVKRIICVCDAFNAMTTNRPYRAALPVAVALAELEACAGTQFDRLVVDALLAVAAEGRPSSVRVASALTRT
jgi:HD-GYP domain-containing protein (c-di-GMP phosphodiesterase class II)